MNSPLLDDTSDDSDKENETSSDWSMQCLRIYYGITFFFGICLFVGPLLAIIFISTITFHLTHSQMNNVIWMLCGFWNILWISNTVLFIRRRTRHPLISRSPILLFFTSIAIFFLTNWSILTNVFKPFLHCIGTHWLNNICYPMFVLPYLLRATRLHSVFKIRRPSIPSVTSTSNIQDERERGLSSPRSARFSVGSEYEASPFDLSTPKRRPWFGALRSQRDLLRWFLLLMLPFIIISLVDTFNSETIHFLPEYLSGCDNGPTWGNFTTIVWTVIHVSEVLGFGYLCFYLRPFWRSFDTTQELVVVAILCCIFAISFILMKWLDVEEDEKTAAVSMLVISRGVGCFLASIVHPTYATYFSSLIPSFPDRQILSSLDMILNDEDAFDSFREFMSKTPAMCLLEFWVEIELLRDCEENELEEGAEKLFEKYFAPQQETQYWRYLFDSAITQNTLERLQVLVKDRNFTKDMYDEAQDEVFCQMQEKDYSLYLRSKECKRFLKEVRRNEVLMKRIITSEIL